MFRIEIAATALADAVEKEVRYSSLRPAKPAERAALSKKKGTISRPPEGLIRDSSIASDWCFPDEQDDYAQVILDASATETATVPYLWHLEVANTLLVGERGTRCTQADTVAWLAFLTSLPMVVDEKTRAHALGETLNLGRAQDHSVYAAAYLELAMRPKVPLATLDAKQKTATQSVSVKLYGAQ